MKRRVAAWLAWSSFAVALGCLAAIPILRLTAPAASASAFEGQILLVDLVFGLGLIGFPFVGALIASRRPENPIGWLFCSVTFGFIGALVETLALYIMATDPGAAAGPWLAWFSIPIQNLGYILLLTFTVLLYPTGRLPSRRWRPLAWLTAAWLAVTLLAQAVAPGPLGGVFPRVSNPVGIEGLATVARLVVAVGNPGIVVLGLASTASLVGRYRWALPDERQQIKWFTFAAAMLIASLILIVVLEALFPPATGIELLGAIVYALSAAAMPVATGFAILRYRLWDIDLIIRRTLVYGLLTAALALIYFGSVVFLQVVFRSLTGEGSQLAVVGSTLAIAALFAPLRGRVQDFIDRRFFRRKYDAARTLAEFAATARDETDLDALAGRLVNVVDGTMQPASVSLWLRPAKREEPL